jgi:Tfp pilus assembly protein PilF
VPLSAHAAAALALLALGHLARFDAELLARLPDADRSAVVPLLRALEAGAVESASEEVAEALGRAPGDAGALRIRALIAVRIRSPEAAATVTAARQAVAATPFALLGDELDALEREFAAQGRNPAEAART